MGTDRQWMLLALVTVLVASVALYGANIWFGLLNQDEGWYLYSALESARGRLPYCDYFFTQGPVLPALYGWFAPLWSPFGVAGGRTLTSILGMGGAILTAFLATRVVAREQRLATGILAFSLTALNVYHSYFTTIPKTYALAAVLLLSGYLALTAIDRPGRVWYAAVAGAVLAMAAGTRISLGATLAITGFWLLFQRRTLGLAWVWFGVGGGVALALIYGPYLLIAPDQLLFANSFHAGREGGGGLLFMAGSVSRCVRGYLPLALIAVALTVWRVFAAPRVAAQADSIRAPRWVGLWIASFVAVFTAQLLSPFPYDDYQVPVMPLLAAAVAVLAVLAVGAAYRTALIWVVVASAILAAGSSPMIQEWFMVRQDRFWVVKRNVSDLAKLRQVGRWVCENSPDDRPLLTPDVYLAVEAQRRVPKGFEMGAYGYFPELDNTRADANHVLNRAGILRLLQQSDAPVAAFSGYAFAIGAPSMHELGTREQAELWQAVSNRYECVQEVPDFGQGSTKLGIWRLRAR
jgi:hypothetical protein